MSLKSLVRTLSLLLVLAAPAAAQIPAAERFALLDLYNNTGGPGWANSDGWNGPEGTECSWYGVVCSEDRVTVLSLPWNNLGGSLRWSLGLLTDLTLLNLGNNQLAGGIPAELGWLANLKSLDLSFNQISGGIPPALGNLASLEILELTANPLMGGIPPEIGNLSRLRVLSLVGNQLTGGIPSEIGRLGNLQNLSLVNNQLTGGIPPEIGNLASLRSLGLALNPISGSLPSEIGALHELQALRLDRTRLSGPLPATLGNLSQLAFLNLAGNGFSGNIPPEIGNLSNLAFLDLQYNALDSGDPSLLAFLESRQPGWRSSQTLPPSNPAVSPATSTSLLLSWTPIPYNWNPGRYEVWHRALPGGSYSLYGTTASKSVSSLAVGGLTPGISYSFLVRTVTDNWPLNPNTLASGFSAEVSGTPQLDTPPGTGVVVHPVDAGTGTAPVTLTFDNVTQGGSTTLTLDAWSGPPPAGFRLGQPPVYYEISTTAAFSGLVTVCIDYSGVSFGGGGPIRLLHFEGGAWVDTTTSLDTTLHIVCGRVGSFSPFLVAQRAEVEVGIDIKPGSFPNSINLQANGTLPVAVLSRTGFDARRVDPRTVTLAGAPVALKPHGELMASFADVNRDGLPDLMLHVGTRDLRLDASSTQAVLLGSTFEGLAVRGADSVRIVY